MTPARLGVLFVFLSSGIAIAEEPLPRGLGHADNPVHWYEMGCCNLTDCEPVEAGAITPVPEGYHVRYLTSRGFVTDGIVTFKSGAVRPSRDQREHACASPARSASICRSVHRRRLLNATNWIVETKETTMRALLFAVLSVVFVSSAHAECYTPPQVTAGIINVVAGSTVAEAPKGFVEAFNAVPPVTNIVADHVLIFTHKSKTNALVAMFNRGVLGRIAANPYRQAP